MALVPKEAFQDAAFQNADCTAAQLIASYQAVRRVTEDLCAPLAVEDYVLQAMPDASPPRWHLAHVSWFFETFLLKPYLPGYKEFNPRFESLFNSYYNTVGPQFPRASRGALSRPTVAEVYAYRGHVDEGMAALLEQAGNSLEKIRPVASLGLNHEQQHQELVLTDTKYNLSVNPLRPAYRQSSLATSTASPLRWQPFGGGVFPMGHAGPGFAFDNETPRHEALLRPFLLASRPVTNGEYLEFMDDGGYARPELWLSLGWQYVQDQGWAAPLYWEKIEGRWWHYTLAGMQPVDEASPACHVSFCEADAFARWKGARLPSEQEWEHAAAGAKVEGNLLDSGVHHPTASHGNGEQLQQLFGDVWEWTQSPYAAYPGFQPMAGALGEYNGKFMLNQIVLRGGSCATPRSHVRATYRNFFPPDARWQFSGIRLAQDAR